MELVLKLVGIAIGCSIMAWLMHKVAHQEHNPYNGTAAIFYYLFAIGGGIAFILIACQINSIFLVFLIQNIKSGFFKTAPL